jgi:Ni/Fe-hydrogenase 1 B-type cytochrome subunit
VPIRIWLWINAFVIQLLIVTDYFIGPPPPTMIICEAHDQFVFGCIRSAYFAAGWVLAIGFLGRIYRAFLATTTYGSCSMCRSGQRSSGPKSGSRSAGICS